MTNLWGFSRGPLPGLPGHNRAMLELKDIEAAAQRIAGQVLDTPCVESRTLSQLLGCQVFLKFENLQYTASFKERGACNKLSQLSADERARGVVAMSAGNHAQGVAYHAQRLGIRAVIVMPRFTPGVKVERTRGFGAEVVLHGDTLDEARTHARELSARDGLVFVHPYDDEAIVAGQGTVALEMLRVQPDLDTLVIAVGGGGLIGGMATAARAIKDSIEGVEYVEADLTTPEGGEALARAAIDCRVCSTSCRPLPVSSRDFRLIRNMAHLVLQWCMNSTRSFQPS